MGATPSQSESFSGTFFWNESKKRDYFTPCHKGEKTQVLELPVAMGPASWRYLAWNIEGDFHKEWGEIKSLVSIQSCMSWLRYTVKHILSIVLWWANDAPILPKLVCTEIIGKQRIWLIQVVNHQFCLLICQYLTFQLPTSYHECQKTCTLFFFIEYLIEMSISYLLFLAGALIVLGPRLHNILQVYDRASSGS